MKTVITITVAAAVYVAWHTYNTINVVDGNWVNEPDNHTMWEQWGDE